MKAYTLRSVLYIGKQQCMDGIDEDYCDKLEYNECGGSEYRCSNGMCIPGEYWLDSDYDCMDWSDETGMYVNRISGRYCLSQPNFDCDEHLCLSNAYSCGDGQCLGFRVRFQTRSIDDEHCYNFRDINYMCELHAINGIEKWWTIKGGYCISYLLPYLEFGWDDSRTWCAFYIKCALTQGLDKYCRCNSSNHCGELVKAACDELDQFYPSQGSILTPYLSILFSKEHDWQIKAPDYVLFSKKGSLKCPGYQTISAGTIDFLYQPAIYEDLYQFKLIDYVLCTVTNKSYRNYSGPQYDKNCWANSTTFTKEPYQIYTDCLQRCFSKYRVRDGVFDCPYEGGSDEYENISCLSSQQQHYRFHCSSSELSCIMPLAVQNGRPICINKRDKVTPSGLVLQNNVHCWQRNDKDCLFLQNYIRQSSAITTFNDTNIQNQNVTDTTTIELPFQYYCNSFINTADGFDESNQLCQQWVCHTDQYQCLSGQCIPLTWLCDGDWDCSDASDEQRLFIMNDINDHNIKIGFDLEDMKDKCSQQYRLNNTPFSTMCNISFEFPCFRRDALGNDLFNFSINRPCINLSQIGDGIIDCIGGADERNLLTCSVLASMLGYFFLHSNGTCLVIKDACSVNEYYKLGSSIELDTVCFYRRQPGIESKDPIDQCDYKIRDNDVLCFDDVCIKNARCNGKVECSIGEDEFWCDMNDLLTQENYRSGKVAQLLSSHNLHQYPIISSEVNLMKIEVSRSMNVIDQLSEPKIIQLSSKLQNRRGETFFDLLQVASSKSEIETLYLPFICNRGLAVKNELDETVCLCPPSFYGELCEYFSDRITVLTHLDLKNYRHSSQVNIIKILATFLFKDGIVDSYEFHVNPSLQTEENYVKQKIYFLYPRSEEFLKLKHNNRSGTQLYSVRFEAFELYSDESIIPLAVWHYPIYFDFLPSFRLSKVLHLPSEQTSSSNNSCSNQSCNMYGRCLPIINHNSTYFCSCKSGYYGKSCRDYDRRCINHCSPYSICKPDYSGMITSDDKPYCLCSTAHYGTTCALKNDQCSENPCQHQGTCYMSYEPADMQNYTCICTNLYYGVNCEIPKASVTIIINSMCSPVIAIATTIQYYDIDSRTQTDLILRNRQVFDSVPQKSLYRHDQLISPIIGIMKLYSNDYLTSEPTYYLGYIQQNLTNINVTNDLQSKCSHVQSLWNLLVTNASKSWSYNSTTAVFSYHRLCQLLKNTTNTTISFRDDNYLCICILDFSRVECFRFDPSSDRCLSCLAGGLCLRNGLKIKNDFKCFCPRCHYGHLCQFLNEFMSFTLDSLIVKHVQSNKKSSVGIYLFIVVLIFLIGLFNNLCSFLTFIRVKPRKFGVGNYLLIISIVDQCSLLLLMVKVIHIVLGSNGTLFYYESLNLYSCKIVSYLLSVFTRITYWLTSLVTIERLGMVLFPTSVTLKKPKLALRLSIVVILTVGGMHVHEILHYMTIIDPSFNVTLCVTNYDRTLISTYNRINVLVHYFVPFFIQVISITTLIVQAARSRARTNGNKKQTFVDLLKKQLRTQKELYITPIIIVLSSLPQTILSFSFACTELKHSWQRYTLLTAYFLSYLPQILGFVLYVLPSTMFKEEFQQTMIGKRLIKKQNAAKGKRLPANNAGMKTRVTKPKAEGVKQI